MLDAYNQWQGQRTPENKERFQEACAHYQQVNPRFSPALFAQPADALDSQP